MKERERVVPKKEEREIVYIWWGEIERGSIANKRARFGGSG